MLKKYSLFFRLLVSLIIIFFLFKFKVISLEQLTSTLYQAKKSFIFFGFFLSFLIYLFSIFRWQFILKALGIEVSFFEVLYSSFFGLFFNLVSPSFIAGDIFKGYSIIRRYKDIKKIASSVIMDRFSGAFALVLVALVSFVLGKKLLFQKQIVFGVFLVCLFMGFGTLLIFSKRFFLFFTIFLKEKSLFKKKLIDFHEQLYFFRKNPVIFLKTLIFSLPIQVLVPVVFWLLSKAFNCNLIIIYFFILVPIILMISLIPISIAGIGTGQAASVFFFSLVGLDKNIAFNISFLNSSFFIFLGLIGGILYVSLYNRCLQSSSQDT